MIYFTDRPDAALIAIGVTRKNLIGEAARLTNGMFLKVRLELQVLEDRLPTMRASFIYQPSEAANESNWVFRFEYVRKPQLDPQKLPYPRSHVHINCHPQGYGGQKSFPDLHLPTRRVTLEQVVWHLIQEHEVKPLRKDWQEVLRRNEAEFLRIQKRREWPYDPPFGGA